MCLRIVSNCPYIPFRDEYKKLKVKSYLCNRPWRPIGLWDVEDPTFCRQSAHRWRLGCHPYAPAALYPQKDLLVFTSVTGWVNPRAMVRLEGLGTFKTFNDFIGTRTRDLPASSIAPQPSTLPRVPQTNTKVVKIVCIIINSEQIHKRLYRWCKRQVEIIRMR
jgi:hypothetical protein